MPKPKAPGEAIVFNFSKVIPMDRQTQGGRRRALAKLLQTQDPSASGTEAKEASDDGGKKSSVINFNIVSEPESADDTKCEDVGVATVDLVAVHKSGTDLVDAVIDVFSAEPQSKVSRLLGSRKPIGTLTVSILVTEVFKSLKI